MRTLIAGLCLAALIVPTTFAYEAELGYVEGVSELTGSCFVRGIKLGEEPSEPIDAPPLQGEALYGFLPMGAEDHAVVLDRSEAGAVLYADTARSGTLEPFGWDRMLGDGSLLTTVPLEIAYDDGATAPYRMIVMWNPLAPTMLRYCRDTYREGRIELATRSYRLAILDEDSDGRYDRLAGGMLLIDADGDGNLLAASDSHERFELNVPFNLGGIVYEVHAVSRDGSSIEIRESDADVPPKPALLVGFPAPDFDAVDAAERPVSLSALRGEVVVLDFWAGWCGPCIAELPTFDEIEERYGDEGVVLLGVNLDRSVDAFEAAVDQLGIESRQIYDGPNGPVNTLYRVDGIPMIYVIDRDGVIRGRGLRGGDLVEAVGMLVAEEDGTGEAQP